MEAIIFMGIQASGKSTFYRKNFFKTHIRINLDMLRTRRRETILFNACLEMKQAFVVDNTNAKTEDRQRYIPEAKAAGFRITGYYFDSDLSSCLERNRNRPPDERIPEIAIRSTHARMKPPSSKEGFDQIIRVSVDKNGKFVVYDGEEIT